MPEVPPGTSAGLASDIWVVGNYSYVGRYTDLPLRVEVFDVFDPANPTLFCSVLQPALPDPPGTGSNVEDVLVEGRYLYAALQDANMDADGVRVRDLVDPLDPAGPTCDGPSFFVAGIPSAHDLFAYDHSSGVRLMLAATLQPTDAQGVHVLNVDDPGAPSLVSSIPLTGRYCPSGPVCGPHDVFAQQVGAQDLLVVASFFDGVRVFDITAPATPVEVAHFGYTWTSSDLDGDTLPNACDANGTGVPNPTATVFSNKTHDAQLSPDGLFIWTAEENRCHPPVLAWELAEVLTQCGPPSFCAIDELAPVAEFRIAPVASTANPSLLAPIAPHQVRFSGPFAFMPWYEEGLRIVDVSDVPATAPVEIASFDTLLPNTDGCFENGGLPVGNCSPSNRGFFGTWGVAWDECYLYLSDRGSPDDNANVGVVGSEGAMVVLRYTGGPTASKPLRIVKDTTFPGGLIASWGEVPFASSFNLYRGTIPMPAGMASRGPGNEYDHQMIDLVNCGEPTSQSTVLSQFIAPPGGPNGATYYYLVTARSPCDEADGLEGNTGQDSFLSDRPDALPTCPL